MRRWFLLNWTKNIQFNGTADLPLQEVTPSDVRKWRKDLFGESILQDWNLALKRGYLHTVEYSCKCRGLERLLGYFERNENNKLHATCAECGKFQKKDYKMITEYSPRRDLLLIIIMFSMELQSKLSFLLK